MKLLRATVITLALSTVATVGHAAPPAPPSPAGHAAPPAPPAPVAPTPDLQEAKLHFQQAVALFNDGNFNAALAEFQRAYDLRPSPGVLYNIGLTQKALFRYDEAVDTLERYLAEETKLSPERRAECIQLTTEMKALLAPITIAIEPAGASVSVDGRSVGKAPLARALRLAAGSHTIETTADGWKSQKRELMVSAGVPLNLSVRLELIPKTGLVHINAAPPESEIRIDGRMLGRPPAHVELGAGGHQLDVQAPKYTPYSIELIIAAGQTRTLDIVLQKPPKRIYEKWYLWTPLALAVAGGLGIGLGLGLKAPDPLRGTLAPGVQPVN